MQDQATLDKYCKSMKSLATSYWEKSGEESRVEWVKKQVLFKYTFHPSKYCKTQFRSRAIFGLVVKREKRKETRKG